MKRWTNMVGKVWRTGGQSKAFTIVELIIVIVVIAILATVTVLGYTAVVNNANDKSVQADLGKVADAANLFSLDNNHAVSNDSELTLAMSKSNFKATIKSYSTDTTKIGNHNLDFCYVSTSGSSYGAVAMSKSGKIFYVTDSSGGVKQYAGSWVTTAGGLPMSTAVLPAATGNSRGYASEDVTTGPWRAWTGSGAATPPLITNLALNPSASLDTTNWLLVADAGTSSTLSSVSSGGPAGVVATYLRSTLNSVPTTSTYTIASMDSGVSSTPVSPSQSYVVSLYARTSCDLATGFRIDATQYDSSGIPGTSTSGTVYPDTLNTWQNIKQTITTGASTAYVQFKLSYVGVTACAVNTKFDITAEIIVAGSTYYKYSDGNTAGWTWNGAANNSTSTGIATP